MCNCSRGVWPTFRNRNLLHLESEVVSGTRFSPPTARVPRTENRGVYMGQVSTKLVYKTGSNYPASGLNSAVQSRNFFIQLTVSTDKLVETVANVLKKDRKSVYLWRTCVHLFCSTITHACPRYYKRKKRLSSHLGFMLCCVSEYKSQW